MTSVQSLREKVDLIGLLDRVRSAQLTHGDYRWVLDWYAVACAALDAEVGWGHGTLEDASTIRGEIHQALEDIPGLQLAVTVGSVASVPENLELLGLAFGYEVQRSLSDVDRTLYDRVSRLLHDGLTTDLGLPPEEAAATLGEFHILHALQSGEPYLVIYRDDRMSCVRIRDSGDVPDRQLSDMVTGAVAHLG